MKLIHLITACDGLQRSYLRLRATPYHFGIRCITRSPFHQPGLTLILAWINNHVPDKVRDEITYPLPRFNGGVIEVSEWISNFIQHFMMDMINYPCWDQSQSMLTRGAENIFTVQLYSTPILRQWAVSLMMLHPQEYQCKWKNMGKYEQINNMNLLGADTVQKQMVEKTVERMYIWYNIWHIIIYRIQPGRPEDFLFYDAVRHCRLWQHCDTITFPSHFKHSGKTVVSILYQHHSLIHLVAGTLGQAHAGFKDIMLFAG